MKIQPVKGLLTLASGIGFIAFLGASIAYAADPTVAAAGGDSTVNICPSGSPFGGICAKSDVSSIIGNLINIVFVIAILIALAFLVWGGIRWILSQGDKTKVASARDMLVAALIGLVVVFLSYFLLNLAIQLLFGTNAANLLNQVTTHGLLQNSP